MDTLNKIFREFIAAQKTKNNKELTALFLELVKARNILSKENGYEDYPEMQLKKIYHIPEQDMHIYEENKEIFANKILPKPNSKTHFLSNIPSIKLNFPEDVISLAATNFPELNKLAGKINITIGGNKADYKYLGETGSYFINIPDVSQNQKVSMLIHEISHVIDHERRNHQIDSIYSGELKALEYEFLIADKISDEFLSSVQKEYLMCLFRTDFLFSIFKNPNLDPVEQYKKYFEKYLGVLEKSDEPKFLYDQKITHTPLVDLPYAVAIVKILSGLQQP